MESAKKEPGQPPRRRLGIVLDREQLHEWAGRKLTDDEVARLDGAIPLSSIPEAIATIVDGFGTE